MRLGILQPDFRSAGDRAIRYLTDFAKTQNDWHVAPDNYEGVRIAFDLDHDRNNGWLLLRLSVHDPVMPLNLESDVRGGVEYMVKALYKALAMVPELDLQSLLHELAMLEQDGLQACKAAQQQSKR